eukprot:1183867-Prorocentrum_minimum.AAC.2
MVEGPQCKLKTRRLQVLCGQKLHRVSAPNSTKLSTSLESNLLEGVVQRVFNVGKECFVVFSSCVLRLHFGMSGSIQLNTYAPRERSVVLTLRRGADICCRADPGVIIRSFSRKKKTATFEFGSHVLEVFDSTVDIRTFAYVAKVEARTSCDILAEPFELETVVGALRADQRAICDSVMDQEKVSEIGGLRRLTRSNSSPLIGV